MFKQMEKSSNIYELKQERSGLLNEASRIVAIASAEGRDLTGVEDARVAQVMQQVQALEEEIARSKRQHGQ
jgi:hypothetical protein